LEFKVAVAANRSLTSPSTSNISDSTPSITELRKFTLLRLTPVAVKRLLISESLLAILEFRVAVAAKSESISPSTSNMSDSTPSITELKKLILLKLVPVAMNKLAISVVLS
jgi:hypothetical protein